MKNRKYIYLIVLSLCLLAISLFLHNNSHKKIQTKLASVPKSESVLPVKTSSNETQKIVNENIPKVTSETQTTQALKNTEVTLSVLGNTYTTNLKNGATVYDAMLSIENTKDDNFSFVANNYSGLGYFVDEIDGVKGSPGKYWIYYVNNKKASVGVSKYILKSGDVINWKQEGM
ncbi:MAG: DUF4430 domain-containing protein [Patescibacteria group bacterium]|nr:DUF4430 domain-containing protein [Patescibacteria group bacterium]